MIIKVDGVATIVHAVTGKTYHIDSEQIDWDATGGSERQMGPEIEYQAVLDHSDLGTLNWSVWEYPAGALNYIAYDVGPHTLVEDFTIYFEHEPDWEPDNAASSVWFRDDEGNAISKEMLARMRSTDQKQVMKGWFLSMFEDPQNETPYAPKGTSSGSAYFYPWGGPYNASDQLHNQFAAIVSEEIIAETVDELEDETGIFEWAPSPSHPGQIQANEDYLAEQHFDSFTLLDQIKTRIESGESGNFSNAEVAAEMQKLRKSIAELRAAIQDLSGHSGQTPGMGHNRPPSDLDVSYEIQEQVEEQLSKVETEIDADNPDPKVGVRAVEIVKQIWG